MLLAVDVGNTQIHIGVFRGEDLLAQWRISTEPRRTADELALIVDQLLAFESLSFSDLGGVVVASVVPAVTGALREMVPRYLQIDPLVVEPGVRTGMPVLTDNPREVGADRIVNAVAAHDLVGGPAIVVDFGTATTFDVVSERGEYLGGAIAPGIEISAEALARVAAQIPRVGLAAPRAVVGKSTVESIRSGVVVGSAAMVDGMVERIQKEVGGHAAVVGTGGLAPLVLDHCTAAIRHEPFLTLAGLRLVHERNRDA